MTKQSSSPSNTKKTKNSAR